MRPRHKEIATKLEALVGKRFNEITLNKALSDIFGEEIKVEEGCVDVDYLADYNLMFNVETDGIAGCFDVYVLKHRPDYSGDTTMYVTEVGYEFERFRHIMDYTNNHDRGLVDKVNRCYATRTDSFYDIVGLLARRDVDEIVGINTNEATIEELAPHYLRHNADDKDLRTIVEYCRI